MPEEIRNHDNGHHQGPVLIKAKTNAKKKAKKKAKTGALAKLPPAIAGRMAGRFADGNDASKRITGRSGARAESYRRKGGRGGG